MYNCTIHEFLKHAADPILILMAPIVSPCSKLKRNHCKVAPKQCYNHIARILARRHPPHRHHRPGKLQMDCFLKGFQFSIQDPGFRFGVSGSGGGV